MLDLYRFTHFSKSSTIMHGISKKSTLYPYDFSLALHTGENFHEIQNNRTTLSENFSKNIHQMHFIVANQTHSDNITIITSPHSKGWKSENTSIHNSDALITSIPNIVLTILTADCVPILLYDKKKKIIAIVHAGWKGTQKQILPKTIQKMIDVFQCNPTDIFVGIGPAIGKCCYEVREDVAKHFMKIPQKTEHEDNKYMLDLPHINKKLLLAMNIPEENIESSHLCTACNTSTFFSYRQEKGCTGRFMSMITLKDTN